MNGLNWCDVREVDGDDNNDDEDDDDDDDDDDIQAQTLSSLSDFS